MRAHLALTIALVLTGCANELGLGRDRDLGHDHHEMTISAEEVVSGWARDGDWLVSPVLEVPDGASRAGALVGLASPGDLPAMEARPTIGGEPAGDWAPLGETWGEDDQHVAVADFAETGDGAQLRIRADGVEILRLLHWTAAIPEGVALEDTIEDPEVGVAREELRSELSGLGIVTRESWGARATRCTGTDTRKTRIAVHHTVTGSSDPAVQMRGIQRFHMDTRGWCDVGYHFLIGQDGRVYEGRPLHLLGAHVASNNTGNIGISFIGCFHTSGCSGLGPSTPSAASVEVAGRLMGSLRRLYGITLSASTVRGHRDHSGQSTTCPGDNLRPRIASMIATGQSSTLGGATPPPAPPPASGASCTHTFGGRYGDRACSASYQCCGGSWRERSAGCGACACTETSGETGCSAPAAPPPGATCSHTFGGRYGNTACSASYQCCDGRWRERAGGGCGACACTETSGATGCGT